MMQVLLFEFLCVVIVQGFDFLYDGCDFCEIGVYVLILMLLFMFSGLEFNWDLVGDMMFGDSWYMNLEFVEFVEKVYRVQEMCYEEQGIFMVWIDYLMLRVFYFVYDLIFVVGYFWNIILSSGELYFDKVLVVMCVVFLMWVFFCMLYSGQLFEVICLLYDLKGGFFEGWWEMMGG